MTPHVFLASAVLGLVVLGFVGLWVAIAVQYFRKPKRRVARR